MSDDNKTPQAPNNEPQSTPNTDPLAEVVKNHEEKIKKDDSKKEGLKKTGASRLRAMSRANKKNEENKNVKPKENKDIVQLSTGTDNSKSQKPEESVIIKPTRKYERTYNAQNIERYTPNEVLSFLSRFDDYQKVNNGDLTHFQIMYRKLKKEDRVQDIKETEKYLKSTGHNI
jgi:hypothetical protein